MLRESNCSKRNCKWYEGVKQPNNDELYEFFYCSAFPDGIPKEIVTGEDLHEKVRSDQVGEYIYEEE